MHVVDTVANASDGGTAGEGAAEVLTLERRSRILQLMADRVLPAQWAEILLGDRKVEVYDLEGLAGVYDNNELHDRHERLYCSMISRLRVGYDADEGNGGLSTWLVDDILDAFERENGYWYGLKR